MTDRLRTSSSPLLRVSRRACRRRRCIVPEEPVASAQGAWGRRPGVRFAPEFLKSGLAARAGCIVLDLRMPGLSGLDLQEELSKAECTMPVVFLTAHGDVSSSVQAMKRGALDFLTKPVDEDVLLAAIHRALAQHKLRRREQEDVSAVRARIRTLTERELEVMRHVLAGELNKQIGARLGVVEKTIKVHRARVMEKMGVSSVAELVRRCLLAGVEPAEK